MYGHVPPSETGGKAQHRAGETYTRPTHPSLLSLVRRRLFLTRAECERLGNQVEHRRREEALDDNQRRRQHDPDK